MVRFLVNAAIFFISAAVGLAVAAWVLPDMTLSVSSFIISVVIFGVMQSVLSPFLFKVTANNAQAVVGGVGLFSTLVALIITEAISDGLQIDGFTTWVLAALIVWLTTMLAALLLPLLVFKKILANRDGNTK